MPSGARRLVMRRMMRGEPRACKRRARSVAAAALAHVHAVEVCRPCLAAVGRALDVLTDAVFRDREVRHALHSGRRGARGRCRTLEAHRALVQLAGELPCAAVVEDEQLLPFLGGWVVVAPTLS